jgi:hypothetical protein
MIGDSVGWRHRLARSQVHRRMSWCTRCGASGCTSPPVRGRLLGATVGRDAGLAPGLAFLVVGFAKQDVVSHWIIKAQHGTNKLFVRYIQRFRPDEILIGRHPATTRFKLGNQGIVLGAHFGGEPSHGKVFMRICAADWSDSELRELRRVEKVLQLTDLAIEISCGLSDEGDPWCVISRRGSNKVLAHFARIDGTCVGHWEGFSGIRSSGRLHHLSDCFLRSLSKASMF